MLLNLSMSDTNLERLAAADVERLAEKAMNQHAKNRGVALQGGQLIDRLHGLNYDDPPTPRRGVSRGGGGDGGDGDGDGDGDGEETGAVGGGGGGGKFALRSVFGRRRQR
jgi:hypothetical protein